MSDIASDLRRFDESYPPSIWEGGGGGPVAPTLTLLAPDTSVVGQPVTVTLTGTGFTAASVAQADGSPLPTVFVNATTLTVTATPITTGTAQITVANGALVSGALTYTVTAVAGLAADSLSKAERKRRVEWDDGTALPPVDSEPEPEPEVEVEPDE